MPMLVTDRLQLRDFIWADQDAVHAFASDPVVTRFMDWGPNDLHDTRAFLTMAVAQTSHRRRTEFEFAAVLPGGPNRSAGPQESNNSKDSDRSADSDRSDSSDRHRRRRFPVIMHEPASPSDRVIGSVSIRITNPHHRQGELGYIFHPAFWSQGYATEAGRALLEFGFGELGLHRIAATCRPDNLGSARVLEKTGMVLEGRMRDHKLVRGEWQDSLLYAAINPDS